MQSGLREELLQRVKCHDQYNHVQIDGTGLFELDGKAVAKACLVRGLPCPSGLLLPVSVVRNLQDQRKYQIDIDQARMVLGEFCARENVPRPETSTPQISAGTAGSLPCNLKLVWICLNLKPL